MKINFQLQKEVLTGKNPTCLHVLGQSLVNQLCEIIRFQNTQTTVGFTPICKNTGWKKEDEEFIADMREKAADGDAYAIEYFEN